MSECDRERFHRALHTLKRNGEYDRLVEYHSAQIRGSAHNGPAFLPWHRLYLLILENALRRIEPSITIPYWNSNLDANMWKHFVHPRDSVIWTSHFAGNEDDFDNSESFESWNIMRNIGAFGSLISDEELTELNELDSTTDFSERLEAVHDSVHVWVGGDMAGVASAPRDIIFFLHHCYIDYLWWQWQWDNRQRRSTWVYPSPTEEDGEYKTDHGPSDYLHGFDYDELEDIEPITNREGYSQGFAFDNVVYDRSPDCTRGTCTGPYLQCRSEWDQWDDWWLGGWIRQSSSQFCTSVANGEHSPVRRCRRSVKKQRFLKKYGHISLLHDWIAPYTRTSHYKHRSIEEKESIRIPKCLKEQIKYPGLQVKKGKSVQNDFRINCEQDISLWAFLPIKIIHLRPCGKKYSSFPVTNGHIDRKLDIYSDLMFRIDTNYTMPQEANSYENCIEDDAGYSKINIRSDGINYYGTYYDYIIIDNRQPIDNHVGYIGFRRPNEKQSEVFITVQDRCGRICIPKCLKVGSDPPEYESCSGVLKVDSSNSRYYGKTYSDAVLMYWSLTKDGLPSEREGEVFIKFYCDFKRRWFPWPGVRRQRTEY
ncbi:hypothetical protein FSP39_005432 [Pinctada imbricata]|uniref:Tyrosinase copper-binding domain-containing protein n=1 Tax=Pinctada imbricata TaxID=66713 RepID=A0AA88XKK9_PINIB|nr:hypothetical protein FSP39_005432 [Pinctada imbricata]